MVCSLFLLRVRVREGERLRKRGDAFLFSVFPRNPLYGGT